MPYYAVGLQKTSCCANAHRAGVNPGRCRTALIADDMEGTHHDCYSLVTKLKPLLRVSTIVQLGITSSHVTLSPVPSGDGLRDSHLPSIKPNDGSAIAIL
jgi:hypothetical protein